MTRRSHDLAVAFGDHWKRYFAPQGADTVVVAVSGGVDSMALLALLARDHVAGSELRIVAAHFDHHTRGLESAEDGRFVAEVASRWGADVELGEGDAVADAIAGGGGPQAAARELRYRFLARIAAEHTAASVATGHHRDDRVETVLLRLVRGTSPEGLAALDPIEQHHGVLIVRPLLAFSRASILAWAEATGVPFRDDPSNLEDRYPRNRMRHEVLPLLAELNPRVDEAIVRLSALAGSDSAFLSAAADDLLSTATESRVETTWRLVAAPLVDAPTALLSRAVISGWAWCAPHRTPPPSGEWIAGAVAFLRRGHGGSVPIPGGGELRRSTGWIEFERCANDRGGGDE